MKKQLALVLFSLLIQLGNSQPVNSDLSNGLIFDGEPYLAINPTNNQNMVAAWMGMKYTSGLFRILIKTRASFDGGNTWSTYNTLPHLGTGFGSADVSMAFDKNGLLYLAYIDYKQSPDSGGIYVTRSMDGGLNWDTPSKAFDMYDVPLKRAIDRPWLVVDNSNTANTGTIYITTKPAPWITPPNRNYYKVSTDSGHTWSAIANVDGGTHLVGDLIAAPMAAPATTINGTFCAMYPSYVASQNIYPAFYLAKSYDKGQTFTYTTAYTTIASTIDTNFKVGYHLATSPIDSNKMVFLSPKSTSGDVDIVALYSNDAGQTWSNSVRVNDNAAGTGKAQDMVWCAYNEVGNLVVTWRDRRNAATTGFWNAGYDFYYAISTDNGQTFSANQQLSSQFIAFDSVIAQNGNDFMSCEYKGDTLYSVWGDTRNGKMNIYFAKTIASTNTNVGITVLDGDDPHWNIYPNPTHGELNVEICKEMLNKELIVYDINGKKLLQTIAKDKLTKINTKDIGKGIHFISIDKDVKRFINE